ncbi:MAG: response regulator transcription factor [Ginsengibacter sp.]
MITVALVDDHVLLRNSLAKIINNFEGYTVSIQADNGQHFIDQVTNNNKPDLVLLDISMPVMDGFDTAAWIKEKLSETKVLVLSMIDSETSIIRMINLGVSGFILKDSKPAVLKNAFDHIIEKGFFSNDLVSNTMVHYVNKTSKSKSDKSSLLSAKEREFIKYACTELTYKEIAGEMGTSPRNIDMYRDQVFEKLELKSRVGLVIYAIREGFVQI